MAQYMARRSLRHGLLTVEDIVVAAADGITTTAGGLWSLDLAIPMLVVNHATAELPGMQAMVGYLNHHFPGVPVEYLDCGFPYPVLTGRGF